MYFFPCNIEIAASFGDHLRQSELWEAVRKYSAGGLYVVPQDDEKKKLVVSWIETEAVEERFEYVEVFFFYVFVLLL